MLPIIHRTFPADVFDAKWAPGSSTFVCVGQSLDVYTLAPELALSKRAGTDQPVAIRCVAVHAARPSEFATGDVSGRLRAWDIANTLLPVFSVQASPAPVNCASLCGCEVAVGSNAGAASVWDTRQSNAAVAVLAHAAQPDCWAVSLRSDTHSCLAGYSNGNVVQYDLRAPGRALWCCNVEHGVCALSGRDPAIVAGLNGLLAAVPDGGAPAAPAFQTDTCTVWSVQHSPALPPVLAAANGDGNVALYKSEVAAGPPRQPIHVLQLSKKPVLSLDWNSAGNALLCTSLDRTVHVVGVQS